MTFKGRQVRLSRHSHQGLGPVILKMGPPGDTEPVPIPGGDIIPPLIHQYVPGPIGNPIIPFFEGENVEPNGITNFRGFIAMAVLLGTATDGHSTNYDLISDLRVYQGEYVSADGTHHRGTFVEI